MKDYTIHTISVCDKDGDPISPIRPYTKLITEYKDNKILYYMDSYYGVIKYVPDDGVMEGKMLGVMRHLGGMWLSFCEKDKVIGPESDIEVYLETMKWGLDKVGMYMHNHVVDQGKTLKYSKKHISKKELFILML